MKTPFFRRRSHHDAAQFMGFISCVERSNQGNKKPVYQNSEGGQIETRVFLTEYSGKNAYKLCRHPFFQKLNELFTGLKLSSQELVEDGHLTTRGSLFYRGFHRCRCNIVLILVIINRRYRDFWYFPLLGRLIVHLCSGRGVCISRSIPCFVCRKLGPAPRAEICV
jgi:hypothetical protein